MCCAGIFFTRLTHPCSDASKEAKDTRCFLKQWLRESIENWHCCAASCVPIECQCLTLSAFIYVDFYCLWWQNIEYENTVIHSTCCGPCVSNPRYCTHHSIFVTHVKRLYNPYRKKNANPNTYACVPFALTGQMVFFKFDLVQLIGNCESAC